jgi:hypothetical protein
MSYLFRTALIVRRKEPYIDWANHDGDEVDMTPELAATPDVYVVRAGQTAEPDAGIVDAYWEAIFEYELSAWDTDEGSWPADRTRELFDAWFDVTVGDSVIDLDPAEPLTLDEINDEAVSEAISACAWCGTELDDGRREVWFMLKDRELLDNPVSLPLSVVVDDEVLTGVIPPVNERREPGEDIVFYACNRDCMHALRKHVPPALRRRRIQE